MSFWDLAQTAATIAAGVYGGPMAGAAVGGGLSAVRGKDVLMGTVSGAMAGYGGQGMDAAASQTALKSGTTNAALNQGINQGITAGTNLTTPTMTGFGGSAASKGITTGMDTGVNLGGGYGSGSTGGMTGFSPTPPPPPQFGGVRGMKAGVDFPNNTIQPTADFGGGGGYETNINDTLAGSNNTSSYYPREFTSDFSESIDITPGGNEGLKNTEIGANLNNPNTNIAKADRYNFVDQSTQMPVDGYSMSEKFDAITNNPRDFLKNYGDGNELYGAGKVGLTGLGLYAAAMEPEDPYGDMEIKGNEVRNRGPQGQLNLSEMSSLNLNNPYGYAEGGGVTSGKSLNLNNIKPNYTHGSLNVNTGSNTPPPPPSAARAVPASGVNVGGGSGVGGIFKPFSVDTQFVMGHGTMPADAVMQGPAQNYTQDIAGNYIRNAQGGMIRGYAEGGYLSGGDVPGDGMSDSIPAMIGRGQRAALSEGEFVVPADVVSHLGNGSSNAGSKQLYAMMDQVRKDRTGTEKQGKQINAERYMPA